MSNTTGVYRTTVFRAKGDEVPEMHIDAVEPLPPITGFVELDKRHRDRFYAQAKLIADALFGSLPGGTLDALLVEMMDRKRSMLVVRG